MSHMLFIYGTLLIPKIQETLLQKKVQSKNAVLNDYTANHIVYGQYTTEYPFLKPNRGRKINGKVLYGLTQDDLGIIHFYEGSEYVKAKVPVWFDKGEFEVNTYLPNSKHKIEFGLEWDRERFIQEHLESYLNEVIPQVIRNYYM